MACVLGIGVLLGTLFRDTGPGRLLKTHNPWHTLLHFGCFMGLATLSLWPVKQTSRWLMTFTLVALIAICSEYVEHLQGQFSIEMADLFTNLVGVVAGGATVLLLARHTLKARMR